MLKCMKVLLSSARTICVVVEFARTPIQGILANSTTLNTTVIFRSLLSVIAVGLLLTTTTTFVTAQDVRREISFPDLPGYQTLKCDMHMHTVFSDGNVWPPIRVDEGWRQGFDVIAITDHLEYQPHKDDLPTNHNRPYELALGNAKARGVVLIRGSEITRETPPGHFNALFLKDCAKLDVPEFLDSVRAAHEQDAFVFWNHQAWQGEEKGRWLDVHQKMFSEKLFQGMEVANGESYYPTAHKWCLEKNLTMLGNSDIHAPDLRLQSSPDDHRTMTLVFAKEQTLPAVKEALLAGRTVVWYKDQLIGKKEYLEPLFNAAVQIKQPTHRNKTHAWLRICNSCDVEMKLTRVSGSGPATISLPARGTVVLQVNAKGPSGPIEMKYNVTNLLIAPETGLPVELNVDAS